MDNIISMMENLYITINTNSVFVSDIPATTVMKSLFL